MENEPKDNDLEKRLSALESQLKAALRSANSVDAFGEPNPTQDPLTAEFKRKMKKHSMTAYYYTGFFVVWAVVSALAFFSVSETKGLFFWTTLFLAVIMLSVLTNLWYWQVWSRYSIVREIKRLELRIVELTEKLEK